MLLSEQYVPPRLLSGILPAALTASHRFWQDQEDRLRGYPVDEAAPGATIVYVDVARTDAVLGFDCPGAVASVSRTMNGTKQVLANVLTAQPHSPLYSLASVLTRVEDLSHVLVWCRWCL